LSSGVSLKKSIYVGIQPPDFARKARKPLNSNKL